MSEACAIRRLGNEKRWKLTAVVRYFALLVGLVMMAAAQTAGARMTLDEAIELSEAPADERQAKHYLGMDPNGVMFNVFVIESIAGEPAFANEMRVGEREAVLQFENMMRMQYPDTGTAGIIGGELDQRYVGMYRRVAWLLANDRLVAARLVWSSVVRMKLQDDKAGRPVGLNFLRFNNFMTHMLRESNADTDSSLQARALSAKAISLADEIKNGYHKRYAKWALTGIVFDDPLAYEAGMRLLDREAVDQADAGKIKEAFALYSGHRFLSGALR